MQQNSVLKGVLLVGLGASFYGMLATFVKMAYKEGFTTAEVTTSQFVLGILGLLVLNIFQTKFSKKSFPPITTSDKKKLIFAGSSMGCTSLFYYLSVQYIDVSVAIVLLMQSVWISVVIEAILKKEMPHLRKIISVLIVLAGTLFATNIINQEIDLDWRGIMWGLLAAASFATTMFAANTIATYASPLRKTLFMLFGGFVIVSLFLFFGQIGPYNFNGLKSIYSTFSDNPANIRAFDFSIFIKYGLILSLFGTILPPILFNSGFPKAGLGLGSIISSMELPVSVAMAFFLLDEKVVGIQWLGIAMILFAIVLMNLPSKKKV